MHIGLIGKFPPLQGGTSTQALWMSYQLAKAGHTVSVVTTSEADAPSYQALLEDDAWERLKLRYPAFHRVSVTQVAHEDPASVYAIPATSADPTRLANELLAIASRGRIDAVIGVYLEPYGVAAALVARTLSVSLALMHAGSDISRLASAPSRRFAYTAILRDADIVLTTPTSARAVIALGVEPDRLIIGRPAFDPPDLFSTVVEPLDVTELARMCERQGCPFILPEGWSRGRFTVVSYGKVGVQKGTRLLLEATARASEEVPISLMVATSRGAAFDLVVNVARELGIETNTAVFPFVAPWEVPRLLALADAATFLENNFRVELHRPRVPWEIAMTATPLILTREVADYQRANLNSGVDCLVLDPPYSSAQLAEHLVSLALNPTAALAMGQAGRDAYAKLPTVNPSSWISELATTLDQGRNLPMGLQDLQEALINLYVNPDYRDLTIDEVSLRHNLEPSEQSTVAGVLGQASALQRFRVSLIEKKWSFLWRQTRANVAADLNDFEVAVHSAFVSRWEFLELPLGRELQDFVDLVAEVSSASADPDLSKALALGRLRLGVLFQFGPVAAGVLSYSERVPDKLEGSNLRIGPWTVAESIETPDGLEYYVGTPSRTAFAADVFQVSEPMHRFVSESRDFVPYETAVKRLASMAEADIPDAAATLRTMTSRGLFEFFT